MSNSGCCQHGVWSTKSFYTQPSTGI